MMKYYGEVKDKFSIVNKKYVDENSSKVFYVKSTEEMEAIINVKHGDLCIVCSDDEAVRSFYCYIAKNETEETGSIAPYWSWITDLGYNSAEFVLELTEGEWDFSLGNLAKITLVEDATLNIFNISGVCYGVIDVYGNYNLTLPTNSYSFPPDWDYLTPNFNQHYRYSFYYDGNKFDWSRSVREND